MIGYGTLENILKLPPFYQLKEEYQEFKINFRLHYLIIQYPNINNPGYVHQHHNYIRNNAIYLSLPLIKQIDDRQQHQTELPESLKQQSLKNAQTVHTRQRGAPQSNSLQYIYQYSIIKVHHRPHTARMPAPLCSTSNQYLSGTTNERNKKSFSLLDDYSK